MKKEVVMAIVLLALGTAGLPAAHAQGKTDQKATFAAVFDHSLSSVENEFVSAAEAMPDDKFNFAPTQGEFKGVRTFAQQIKHVAAVNVGSENGPENLTSKADIVKFLKDSFAYLHKAVNSIDETNVLEKVQSPFGSNKITRLSLTIIALGHPFDHYGQMVEYLRMNNIIPPASRGQ